MRERLVGWLVNMKSFGQWLVLFGNYLEILKFGNLEIIWKLFGQWLVNIKLFLPFILPFSCEPMQVNMREFENLIIWKLFGNFLVNGWSI